MDKEKIELQEIINTFGFEDGFPITDESIAQEHIEEVKMQGELSLMSVFELGNDIESLQNNIILSTREIKNITEREEFNGDFYSNVGDILKDMLGIEILAANVDAPDAIVEQIKGRRERIMKEHDELDECLSMPEARTLMAVSNDWHTAIKNALGDKDTITIENKAHLNIRNIVRDPSGFFGPEVWDWLNEEPKSDIKESCSAIAYGLPTASVMLSLRAVEHCLRNWYEYDTSREIDERNWGEVVGELEDVYESSSDRPPVLSNLDYLKERRNAVSHPDEVPSEKEAERMLFRIEGTISEIHERLSE